MNRVFHYQFIIAHTQGVSVGRKASCLAFRSTATCRGVFILLHPLFSSFKESQWAGKHHVPHDAFWSTATCRCSSSSTPSLFFQDPGHSSLHARHPLATRSLDGPESIMSSMMLSGLPCNKRNLGSCTARRQDPDNYRTVDCISQTSLKILFRTMISHKTM